MGWTDGFIKKDIEEALCKFEGGAEEMKLLHNIRVLCARILVAWWVIIGMWVIHLPIFCLVFGDVMREIKDMKEITIEVWGKLK